MSDLIDRRAAIDECYPVMVDGEVYEVVQVETLMGLPSAEPKTGRWMFPDPPIHKPICSECGKPCIGLHAFEYVLTDYCPNCGARMEGEDNEAD